MIETKLPVVLWRNEMARDVDISICHICRLPNVLDNRSPKCQHYCKTCASSHRRIENCKEHPH